MNVAVSPRRTLDRWLVLLAVLLLGALLRFLEDGRRGWLLVAGVVGGLSILVKVVGLYYIAGVLLFFVFEVQETTNREADGAPRIARGYAAVVTGALLLFVAALLA